MFRVAAFEYLITFYNREYDAKYGQCIESMRVITWSGVKIVIGCLIKPVQTII